MEEDGQTTPFWLQSSTYFQSSNHHHHHRRRRLSSFCLNSGFLIVVLSIVGLITIFFVIPSFLSFTSHVFRPNLVKKSWDNLNLVLVLFAILCGILGRKRDDGESNGDVGSASNATQVPEEPQQQQVQQQQWYGYSDQGIHEPIHTSNNSNMVGRLKRNSSSYPDLRETSSWVSSDDQNWRFFDDNYVYNHRLGSSSVYRRKQRQEEDVVENLGVKTIPVDRYVVPQQELSSPPPLPASPPTLSPPRQSTPPPPPPPPPVRHTSEKKHKARQTFQSVPHKEHSESKEMEFKKIESPPQQSSPPPQSPPEESTNRSEKKAKKHERKKSGGAKEIASTLASLYNQRKRKKKHKSKENFDDIFQSPSYTHSGPPPSPPPPPPPPPPPASVFHQLFKKGSKSKRIHSFSASSSIQQQKPSPPPSPPPLPHMSPLRPSKRKPPMPQPPPPPPPPAPPSEFLRPRKPMTPGRPPLPSKINSFFDENLNTGNQSPLVPMPPPPPPFKMRSFKFVVRGDYVRLQSSHSSRSNSPDLDFTDTPPTSTPVTPTTMDGGEAGVSAFCPSPDVNTKADTFIARFRAGLRMESANSFKEKQELSTLGPSPRSKPSSS
ncbi:hypothetical protein AQUCO_00100008v1 [Aquilegia coerulea]|uniref:Uncharacterized protein n=1 Tax=Aquilegia coerulea TaxID=218851 RepID=A0A2G5F8A1_AQUCA|nr:hypothetical protein AQUCO_00100008v1 [Aquilegia coerulea]